MKYIIYGDPVAISQNKSISSRIWENLRQHKIYYSIELENQHDQQPLFEGPISMEVNFYIDKKHKPNPSQYHSVKPAIVSLGRFLETVCAGTIYESGCNISILSAKKLYSEQPRTEITVEKL